MKSAEYWEKRALDRESRANKAADAVLHKKIYNSYDRAATQITQDVNKIFTRYMVDGKLSENEAKALLSSTESEDVLKQLKDELESITDPEVKQKALNRLHAQAYAARITRLEAVRERVYTEMAKVSDDQISKTKSLLGETVEETYYRSIFDIQQGTGMEFDFADLPKKSIDSVINENWSGKHFSKRVWSDTQLLADEAYKTISTGLMSGLSIRRMADQLDDTMLSGKYAATRLVRTETNRSYNAAEKLAYEETEIDEYRYLATLDSRTCEVCGALDSKVYPVKSAKEGLNYPPMHPNDRCTTVANFGDETLDNLKRRARDPETGETKLLNDNISFTEWKKKNNIVSSDFEPYAVEFNKSATFNVSIPNYTKEVSDSISSACKKVAELGASDKKEHLILVNSKTGKWELEQIGDKGSVGDDNLFEHIKNNPDNSYSFVHNHPSGEILSLIDLNTFFANTQITSFVASGHNGKVYVAHGNKKPMQKKCAMSEAFTHDDEILKDLRKRLKEGKIDMADFPRAAERLRVNYLTSNYCDYMEVQT